MTRDQKWRYALLHGWTGVGYGFLIVSGLSMILSATLKEQFASYWHAFPYLVFVFLVIIVPLAIKKRFGHLGSDRTHVPVRNAGSSSSRNPDR